MTARYTFEAIVIALFFLIHAVPVQGKNYLLHSPKLWSPQEKEQYDKENPPEKPAEKHVIPAKKELKLPKKQRTAIKKDQVLIKDGVSYREVTVQRGDTVYGISRKYSKEGASYAETVRFNEIDDPDQITSGDIIKVPLHPEKKKLQPPAQQIKAPPEKTVKKPVALRPPTQVATMPPQAIVKTVVPSAAETLVAPVTTALPRPQIFTNNSTAGQKLFEQAITSYRSGDCQTAIQLFARFLAEHTTSALVADASLFIADCYLRLAGK